MLRRAEEYYALYVVWEDGESEITDYTTPDGPVQQEDLEKWGA